jgi:hypothetical protein
MTLIKNSAYLIPRGTSQLMIVPAYEKPLLQVKFNTGMADRAKWVQTLPAVPKDLPPAAHARELNCESEMTRLSAQYGVDSFRKVYPVDELFVKAFDACATAALPTEGNAVPDMVSTPTAMVDEFIELNVPSLDRTKAEKLVEAKFTVSNIGGTDTRAISAATGLSNNLIRSIVEASQKAVHSAFAAAPRGAPSAPSLMRATSIEAPVPA